MTSREVASRPAREGVRAGRRANETGITPHLRWNNVGLAAPRKSYTGDGTFYNAVIGPITRRG
jgi:hypothetical protein